MVCHRSFSDGPFEYMTEYNTNLLYYFNGGVCNNVTISNNKWLTNFNSYFELGQVSRNTRLCDSLHCDVYSVITSYDRQACPNTPNWSICTHSIVNRS